MLDKEQTDTVEFGGPTPMFSASGRASEYKFFLFTGKSGKRWVVADQLCPGENVWVDGGKGSEGSAGRTITFELANGGSVDFIGPWKTTTKRFTEDCGIKLPDHQWMTGVVATEVEGSVFGPRTYGGVIRHDPEPVLGNTDEYRALAQRVANERGVPVFWQFKAYWGGSSSCEKPKAEATNA